MLYISIEVTATYFRGSNVCYFWDSLLEIFPFFSIQDHGSSGNGRVRYGAEPSVRPMSEPRRPENSEGPQGLLPVPYLQLWQVSAGRHQTEGDGEASCPQEEARSGQDQIRRN